MYLHLVHLRRGFCLWLRFRFRFWGRRRISNFLILQRSLQKDDMSRRGLEKALARLENKAYHFADTTPANPLAESIARGMIRLECAYPGTCVRESMCIVCVCVFARAGRLGQGAGLDFAGAARYLAKGHVTLFNTLSAPPLRRPSPPAAHPSPAQPRTPRSCSYSASFDSSACNPPTNPREHTPRNGDLVAPINSV